MANTVNTPFDYYGDPRRGRPLFNAKIFIGVADLDPTIPANQLQASYVQEDGTRVNLTQPIRTNSGGYPVNSSGDLITIEVQDANFSFIVQDRSNIEVINVSSSDSSEDIESRILTLQGQVPTSQEQLIGLGSSIFPLDIDTVAENHDGGNDDVGLVPAGTTHLRVPITGNPEVVAINPASAGGAITLLTEVGCSIGGVATVFIPSLANNNTVLTPGASAIYRDLRERFNEVVNILDHGASTSKTATENSAAITNAVTYANSLGHPVTFVIPQGVFNINRIDLDLPNGSIIECFGNFISEVSGDTAILIGSPDRNVFWLEARGIRVNRSAADVTSGSIGVRLQNLVWCKVDIRSVTGYQEGVYCVGSQGNGGFSYNTISLGQLHDNRNNLHLTASNGINGYCNENIFEQGGFNHSSGYPNVTTTNLLIDHHAENELNNNRFIAPSFEDNSSIAIAATINGNNNIIMFPRMENPEIQSTYKIQFTAQSSECQILGAGFFLVSGNVEDLGDNNAYETRSGRVISHQTPDTLTDAVLSAQSTVSNNAIAFAAKGTAGDITGYMRCDGMYFSPNTGYFENGVRMSTSSGTLTDYGVFITTANPEGNVTASAGSICISKNGSVYRKQSGSGNVGWGVMT